MTKCEYYLSVANDAEMYALSHGSSLSYLQQVILHLAFHVEVFWVVMLYGVVVGYQPED